MKKIRLVLPPPKEQKKLRVAAYCRVSTKSKAQKESLRNQILYYTERILDNDNSLRKESKVVQTKKQL